MLSTLVQFCTEWIGTDYSSWSKLLEFLIVLLIIVGPRKILTIRKTGENKWIISFMR